jgi:uncharacterized Zn finger protein (UPF0148 family)
MDCLKCGTAVEQGVAFCPSCGAEVSFDTRVRGAESEVASLKKRIVDLESHVREVSNYNEKYVAELRSVVNRNAETVDAVVDRLNGSSLLSDSFWVRAFTVYGYILIVGALAGSILLVVSLAIRG